MSAMELGKTQRNELAGHLKLLRAHERNAGYALNRSAEAYDITLEGYTQSLDYVRALPGTNTVLDIGAGTTKAISQISESTEGQGLDFKATVLSYTPDIEENLGMDKTLITPAETLRGVKDNSVGLALTVYSITYSINPYAAINRINEVLVPGGLLKGRFNTSQIRDLNTDLSSPPRIFQKRLEQLGYDIALGSQGLLLAKKTGGSADISAKQLLLADKYQSANFANLDALDVEEVLRANGLEI